MKIFRTTSLLVILFSALSVFSADDSSVRGISKKRILMVIAPKNFRDEELFVPKRIFTLAGYKVVVASIKLSKAKGMLGGIVRPNILLKNVKLADYAAIVFVGGSGSTVYYDNSLARNIAVETVKKGKVLGGICLAPGIFAKAGILKGRHSTAFKTACPLLRSKGAKCSGAKLARDKKIVTASGPDVADQFADLILKTLRKSE